MINIKQSVIIVYLSARLTVRTSHIVKHLRTKYPQAYSPIKGQTFLQSGKVTTDSRLESKGFKFNQEKSRNDLGRIVILHEYPFSIVEYCGFREYSKNLQPLFKMASRRTITNNFLKFFEDEKEKLFRKASNVFSIAPNRMSN